MRAALHRDILPAISVSILTCCFASAALGADGEPFGYYYFKELVPLTLDGSRVAVQAAPNCTAALPAVLGHHGIDAGRVQARGVPGWAEAPTPNVARTAADIDALIADLTKSSDVAFASPVFLDSRGEPVLITPDLLIGFHEGIAPEAAEQLLAGVGTVHARDFGNLPGVYLVRAESRNGFAVLALANRLALQPEIRFSEPDLIVRARLFMVPNDPLFSQQWGLAQASDQDMDAPEAWDVTTGDESIVVAVMDAGIQQNHPDLNQIPGQDFSGHSTPGGGPYNNCDNHGTCVAGCIAAIINNSTGVVGVAPGCRVRSAKIGTGIEIFGFCTPFVDMQESYLVNALAWVVSSGARISNSSFGLSASAAITTAYDNARANGVIHFAATGNDGTSTLSYPASLASVNAVGALASSGSRASFSNYGTGIDFSTPGEGILTTDRTGADGYATGDYATEDGTSFASPYAAGVAALVWSRNPALTADQVEQLLRATCVDLGSPGYDTTYGWGFMNANNAVLAAAPPICRGDANCSNMITWRDIDYFVAAQNDNQSAWFAKFVPGTPSCTFATCDVNADGHVTWRDISPFVALMNTTCP